LKSQEVFYGGKFGGVQLTELPVAFLIRSASETRAIVMEEPWGNCFRIEKIYPRCSLVLETLIGCDPLVEREGPISIGGSGCKRVRVGRFVDPPIFLGANLFALLASLRRMYGSYSVNSSGFKDKSASQCQRSALVFLEECEDQISSRARCT
jgi:hypothetical protein